MDRCHKMADLTWTVPVEHSWFSQAALDVLMFDVTHWAEMPKGPKP
jgi:hypothetical protein